MLGPNIKYPKNSEREKKKVFFLNKKKKKKLYLYIYIFYSLLILYLSSSKKQKKKTSLISLETIKPKSKNQFKREHKQKTVQHKQYGQRSVTSGESPLRFGLQVSLSLCLSV